MSRPKILTLADAEKKHILEVLKRFEGHRERTAEALGIAVRTLSMKLRSYGIRGVPGGAPVEEKLKGIDAALRKI